MKEKIYATLLVLLSLGSLGSVGYSTYNGIELNTKLDNVLNSVGSAQANQNTIMELNKQIAAQKAMIDELNLKNQKQFEAMAQSQADGNSTDMSSMSVSTETVSLPGVNVK